MTSAFAVLDRPVRLWKMLWIAPDRSTTKGRAQDRERRVILSAGASALAKAITILTQIISVPLTLNYLGPERYGVWLVISSLTLMLSFADMGLGNGVLNAVAHGHGQNDRTEIRKAIASGYAALTIAGLAILLLFFGAYPWVRWDQLFNVSAGGARLEVGPALAAFVICFSMTIPINLVQKIQTGLQQGFVASLWQCLGSIVSLVALVTVILLHGGLVALVFALVGAPLLAALINSIVFFATIGVDLLPRWSFISLAMARTTMRAGLMFFLIQIVASFAYGSDTLIVAQVSGAAAVAQYAVPERMFAMISMIIQMILVPLWPAYGEAISRGDNEWVARTLWRSVAIAAVAASVLTGLLVVIGPFLLNLWVGSKIQPTIPLLLGLAGWRVVETVSIALATLMNGANLLREQVIISFVSGLLMLALKVALVKTIGVAGIPWAAIIVFVPFGTIPMTYVVSRYLKSTKSVAHS